MGRLQLITGPDLGLAIALQHGQSHRIEEHAHFGAERRAAGHHGFQPPAELLADLGPQRLFQHQVHRPVAPAPAALRLQRADPQGPVHHEIGQPALLFDLLHDPGAQHFEQPRDHDHYRRAHLLDIAGELFQSFRIIDLGARADRQHLPAGVFVGVAERKEGQEGIVVIEPEILRQDLRRSIDIAQDRSVMLHHPARRSTGAAGIDQAGDGIAVDAGDPFGHRLARGRAVTGDQSAPLVVFERASLADPQGFDADHVPRLARA